METSKAINNKLNKDWDKSSKCNNSNYIMFQTLYNMMNEIKKTITIIKQEMQIILLRMKTNWWNNFYNMRMLKNNKSNLKSKSNKIKSSKMDNMKQIKSKTMIIKII